MRFGNPGDPFKEDWGPYGCAKNWKNFPGYNKHDLCRHKCRPEDMKQCQGCGYWFCVKDWAQRYHRCPRLPERVPNFDTAGNTILTSGGNPVNNQRRNAMFSAMNAAGSRVFPAKAHPTTPPGDRLPAAFVEAWNANRDKKSQTMDDLNTRQICKKWMMAQRCANEDRCYHLHPQKDF